MDHIRCQVDLGFDAFNAPLNQVQIQVKIDGPDNLNVWVVNTTTLLASPAHMNLPSIGGTVAADWDSSPDLNPITNQISAGVLLISPDFVVDGQMIEAHASDATTGVEILTMSAGCDIKVPGQFRQQTKPPAGPPNNLTLAKTDLINIDFHGLELPLNIFRSNLPKLLKASIKARLCHMLTKNTRYD